LISLSFSIVLIFFGGIETARAGTAAKVGTDFLYTFKVPGVLDEVGSMDHSSSPFFYLNSGGKLVIEKGIGKTIQGNLVKNDTMHTLYAKSNSLDTDSGYHPQNLLRLLTRSAWGDTRTQVAFRITGQNYSDSPNRDGHNGVLIMNRYQDGDNLYYAGIRNDGEAVIKKKIGGTYHTLASVQIFGKEGQYDRDDRPSLLPISKWMRLKTEVFNQSDGSVRIRLFLDRENDGSFVSILAADDKGVGGAPLRGKGYGGIRSDFMDIEFDNLRLTAI
jgi:hypothetical protein